MTTLLASAPLVVARSLGPALPARALRFCLAGLWLVLLLALPAASLRAQVLPRTFAGGSSHSLSIHADGTLWATGDNSFGQLGIPTSTSSSTTWVQVGTATNWVQVASGSNHSLGLRADGSLYGWGYNYYGQLGNATGTGTYDATPTPTRVGTDTYTQVAAGGSHSLGLRADGRLYAWGLNNSGQLGNATGNGTATAYPTPTVVAGTYAQVAAGANHSLGLRVDGSVYTWGYNRFGQLGTATGLGTINAYPTPTPIPGSTYTQVAGGANHGLGLRADGSLWDWGYTEDGELGNGSAGPAPVPTPTREATAGTSWTTLGTGPLAYFSLVRTPSAQNFASAGNNDSGQLGDGTTTNATRFDRVSPLLDLQPLPVELSAFTATLAGTTAVRLAWATASQKNSAAFEVERSIDGASYYKVGTVVAAGRSSTGRTYGFFDEQLPAHAAVLYYRLKLVDADGAFSYSPVRSVGLSGAAAGLALFPNPAHSAATLLGALPGAVVTVVDALGRPVTSATADASGTAALALPAGLPAGVYVVRAGTRAVRLTVE